LPPRWPPWRRSVSRFILSGADFSPGRPRPDFNHRETQRLITALFIEHGLAQHHHPDPGQL
jgi:hypothetical protein